MSNRRIQYLVAFAVSLVTLSNGATLFWTSTILPRLHNKEILANITSVEISWVVSIMVFGLLIGTSVSSYISDNFGRRTTLMVSAFPHIIGTVMVWCATNIWMLYIGRILWGCAIGLTLTVSSIYLSEIADKEIRGTLTAITRLMLSVGVLIVLTVGSYVPYQVLSGIMLAFPLCYFLACMWTPESPYYLIKVGKVDAAKKALIRLASENKKMIDEKLSLLRSDVRKEMARSGSLKELFTGKQYRRAIITSMGLRVFTLLTGIIPMQQYFGMIIQQSNCGVKVSTALVTFGVVRFLVGFISPFTVDRIGRRPLLICSYSAAGIVLSLVGLYFFMQQVIGIDDEPNNPFRYVALVGIISVSSIANIGYNILHLIIPAELFPINVKSIAMTVLFISTSIIQFIVIRGYQIMEDSVGLFGVIWFYSIMCLIGAVFSYFVVPETKGKSLREIQIELQGNIYDESNETLNQVQIATNNVLDDEELTEMIKVKK